MNLSDDVDMEDYVARPDKITGADINSICQEVARIGFLLVVIAQLVEQWTCSL